MIQQFADQNEFSSFFIQEEFVSSSESFRLEFKNYCWPFSSKLQFALCKAICGFLNREGGTILIGVDDTKKVVGINLPGIVDEVKRYFDMLKKTFNPLPEGLIKTVEVPVKDQKNEWIPNQYILRLQVTQGLPDRYYTFQNNNSVYSSYREDSSLQLVSDIIKIQDNIYFKSKNPNKVIQPLLYEDPSQQGLSFSTNSNKRILPIESLAKAELNQNLQSMKKDQRASRDTQLRISGDNQKEVEIVRVNGILDSNRSDKDLIQDMEIEEQFRIENQIKNNNNNIQQQFIIKQFQQEEQKKQKLYQLQQEQQQQSKQLQYPLVQAESLQQQIQLKMQDGFSEEKQAEIKNQKVLYDVILFVNVFKDKHADFIEFFKTKLLEQKTQSHWNIQGYCIACTTPQIDMIKKLKTKIDLLYKEFKFGVSQMINRQSDLIYGMPYNSISTKSQNYEEDIEKLSILSQSINFDARIKKGDENKNQIIISNFSSLDNLVSAFNFMKDNKLVPLLSFFSNKQILD